ncbi:TonB family protein [Prolixibacteraceae bacterium JC049]|nr:TonB family protein [Prolixibacteraceae bacterium JC049]
MGKFKETYRKNINAIIGTLIFHILLLATFILAGVNESGYFKEEGIVIDFEEIPDIAIPEEEKEQEQSDNTEEGEEPNMQSMSNRAINKAAPKTKDKVLNDDFMKEIEAAQKLAADVSNQLKKEIVDIDDMPMPEVKNDEPDSPKNNVINYGESRNFYELKDRYHTRFFIPTYLAQKGGVIVVDIVVNRNGRVISAIVRNAEKHPELARYAKSASMRSRFNKSAEAPEKQRGTITYTFVAQ